MRVWLSANLSNFSCFPSQCGEISRLANRSAFSNDKHFANKPPLNCPQLTEPLPTRFWVLAVGAAYFLMRKGEGGELRNQKFYENEEWKKFASGRWRGRGSTSENENIFTVYVYFSFMCRVCAINRGIDIYTHTHTYIYIYIRIYCTFHIFIVFDKRV